MSNQHTSALSDEHAQLVAAAALRLHAAWLRAWRLETGNPLIASPALRDAREAVDAAVADLSDVIDECRARSRRAAARPQSATRMENQS